MGNMSWTAMLQKILVNILGKTEAFGLWGFFCRGEEWTNLIWIYCNWDFPSSAASEQISDPEFLARQQCSDVIWDGISADTCTFDFPTAAHQVRIDHMPWHNCLISVLEVLSQSQSFCCDFWLMKELSWRGCAIPGTWVDIFRACSNIAMYHHTVS